jgi:hypothetical protein
VAVNPADDTRRPTLDLVPEVVVVVVIPVVEAVAP